MCIEQGESLIFMVNYKERHRGHLLRQEKVDISSHLKTKLGKISHIKMMKFFFFFLMFQFAEVA